MSQINRRADAKIRLFDGREKGCVRATNARNASNLFVTVGSRLQVQREATARSLMPSYSNRIFQEQFSITTTVLTKPFPSCKMHEDGFFFFSFFSTWQPHLSRRWRRRSSSRNLEARESRRRQRREENTKLPSRRPSVRTRTRLGLRVTRVFRNDMGLSQEDISENWMVP